jgi:hypothetical protein
MADAPYLVALALLEQGGERAMPLQGKSLREPLAAGSDPGEEGRLQALELLVRVWQRSEQGLLRRAAGERSLLLAEVPMAALLDQLPACKAQWLSSGDTDALLGQLLALGGGVWRVGLEQRGPLQFTRIG